MKSTAIYEKLERERRRLIHLIDACLKKGIPITQNEAILEQSRKVDALIIEMQKGIGKTKPNQRER